MTYHSICQRLLAPASPTRTYSLACLPPINAEPPQHHHLLQIQTATPPSLPFSLLPTPILPSHHHRHRHHHHPDPSSHPPQPSPTPYSGSRTKPRQSPRLCSGPSARYEQSPTAPLFAQHEGYVQGAFRVRGRQKLSPPRPTIHPFSIASRTTQPGNPDRLLSRN